VTLTEHEHEDADEAVAGPDPAAAPASPGDEQPRSRRRPPWWRPGRRGRQAVTLLVAAGLAAAACAGLRHAFPDRLDVRTDVMGYPTFVDFNVRVYFVNYLLVAVVFPVLALAVYTGATAVAQRGRRVPVLPATTPGAPPTAPTGPRLALAAAAGRAGLVGVVLGAGVAVAAPVDPSDVAPLVGGLGAGYVAALLLVAVVAHLLAHPTPAPFAATVSAMDALAAPVTLLALVAVSQATRVTVVTTGEVVHHPWLPLPVALAGVAAGLAVVVRRLLRTPPDRWPALDRSAVGLVVVPVGLWLLTSSFHVTDMGVDVYHEGEVLAATRRIAEGAFPWRDVIFIHGMMGDVLPGLLARGVFGDSRWANQAVGAAFLNPLFWVGQWFLCRYLFRRNWLLLAASQALALLGALPFVHTRMMLLPYLLLALGALLGRATWPRAAAVATLAVVQFVLAPDASYFSLTALLAVVLFDIAHRRPGDRLVVAFGRTLRTAVVGAGVVALFLAYLAANRSVGAFFHYYRTFVDGHELSGGVPIVSTGGEFDFWMVAPVVLVVATWWFVAARVGSRRWLTVPDWVMAAAVLGVLAYYGKFLSRADVGHLGQVGATAAVPLLYAGYRLVEAVEAPLRRRWAWAVPVSAAVLVAAVAVPPGPIRGLAEGLPGRWTDTATRTSTVTAVGYQDTRPTAEALRVEDPRVLHDLDVVLDAYLGPDGRLFDFTNSPGLFGFLLDQPNATRYFHVSMAKPAAVQRDLIAEIERERPELVVFTSTSYGLPSWDQVPNAVRHYLVADHVLDHYVPTITVHGYTLFRRDDVAEVPVDELTPRLSTPPLTDDLLFRTQDCDWGYEPQFFSLAPNPGSGTADVPFATSGPVVAVQGWAADAVTLAPVPELLAVVDSRVVARVPVGSDRPDAAAMLQSAAAGNAGFSGTFPRPRGVEEGPAAGDRVRIYGLTASGVAGELHREDGREPSGARDLIDGAHHIPVDAGALVGSLEHVEGLAVTYRLDLPADASEHDWLQVTTAEPLVDDRITVEDPESGAGHPITFRTRPDGDRRTVEVMVGACPQWQGYDPGEPLLLRTHEGVAIDRVRLVR